MALAACGGSSDDDDSLTIYAAASLTEAFTEIGKQFAEENDDADIEFNFAGSQALVTQLVEGANADVFASANTRQMDRAVDEQMIAGSPQVFAENALVIIVPADNPAEITVPADLANDGVKIVFAAEDVPVGEYTRTMLDTMSQSAVFGEDFRAQVEGNIVSNESNVKQVVTKVQLGEADAGVVYRTDVTQDVAEDVTQIEIADEFNVIASYPIATVADGNEDFGQEFIDYIRSEAGEAILSRYGFRIPAEQ